MMQLEERPPYVQFEMREIEDRQGTLDNGHYTAKEVPFALITPSGSKDQIERQADEWLEMLKQQTQEGRFKPEWLSGYTEHYRMWKEGQSPVLEGTDVRTWPAASASQVKLLRDARLLTVEDLARANEEAISRLGMGGRALKDRAVQWLKSASDIGKQAEEVAALKAANEDLSARNASLEAQLKELSESVAALKQTNERPRR